MGALRVQTLPLAAAALLAGCGDNGLPTEMDEAQSAASAKRTERFRDDIRGVTGCREGWTLAMDYGLEKYDHDGDNYICWKPI